MLDGSWGHIESGGSFPNAAERIDHFAGCGHIVDLYDIRIARQAYSFDNVTSVRRPTFVHKGMDDRDRIIAAFESSEMSRDDLASAMRVSVPSLGRLLRKERELKAGERDRAFQALGLGQSIRQIPVIGKIPAGDWREAIQNPLGTAWYWRGGPNTFALVVEGDSLDNIIAPGSHVAIDPDECELTTRKVYAVADEDWNTTLKRFMADPARLEPDSTNPAHKPIIIGRDKWHILGRALDVLWDPSREL